MEKISPPVQAIEDDDLEQVSGGAMSPMEITNLANLAYSQFNQLANSVLSPWVDSISETAFKIKYRKPLEVLATYNNSTSEDKASIYAQSWNKKHPDQAAMSDELAEVILSIPDAGAQVAIACLPDVDSMIQACRALANGGVG